MHMADSLLSPAVGSAMCVASGLALGYATRKVQQDEACEYRLPLLAVSGAFIFAAQMLNFALPGLGSSGHIGGGIFLATLLGEFPALVAMACVLVIQCLFFADGGLLALGCNLFNMGVIPCLVVYPLVVRPLRKRGCPLSWAVIIASVLSLEFGALGVTLETLASGVVQLPAVTFLEIMLGVHLLIGLVEGVATAALLKALLRLRPEVLTGLETPSASFSPYKPALVALLGAALLCAGAFSLGASSSPDGLEWSLQQTVADNSAPLSGWLAQAAQFQNKLAFFQDYQVPGALNESASTSGAGLIGALLTLGLAVLFAAMIWLWRRHRLKQL